MDKMEVKTNQIYITKGKKKEKEKKGSKGKRKGVK